MVTLAIPFLVLLLGFVVYMLAPGKWCEIGRICFAVGLLVTLLVISGHVVHFGP